MKDGGDIFAVEFRNEFMAFFFGRDFYGFGELGWIFLWLGNGLGFWGGRYFLE